MQYCIGFAIHQHASATGVHVFPILSPLPPPSPYHPSGSSQCTSTKHPVSCIEPGLAICFTYDIIHVSMPFSQIIPASLSHIYMEFRKMVTITLYERQQKRHRCKMSFYFIIFFEITDILFIFFYNIILVLPYINMNPPRVYTCSPSRAPSHLPPRTIPLGHHSAPAPSIMYPALNLDWRFVSHIIISDQMRSHQSLSCVRLFVTP